MKTVSTVSNELNSKLSYITSYDRTKILILVDRVLSKPYSNHRLELNFYSIRYKAVDKQIYVYNKAYDFTDNFDYEGLDNFDFPNDFSIKITIDSYMEMVLRILKIKLRGLYNLCVTLI